MCQRERLIFRAVRRDTARARFPIMAKHQVLGACSGLLHRVPSFDSCVENKIIGQRTDGDQNFKYVWVVLVGRSANAQTQIQIYGSWHCGSGFCTWGSVRDMTDFDTKNHWIDRKSVV